MGSLFDESIEKLKRVYAKRYFTEDKMYAKGDDLVFTFPGDEGENILVNVHQSEAFTEPFHTHDYFFFKYAYKGSFESINDRFGNVIKVQEGELYIGQPNASHAVCVHDNLNVIMICFIIRKDAMFRTFLPLLIGYKDFFQFLLNPSLDESSDEYVHLKPHDDGNLVRLIKMIVIEAANKKDDSPVIIESLMHAFLAQVAREASTGNVFDEGDHFADEVVEYISQNIKSCTLESVAGHFSYSANYFSTLLSQKLDRTFSQIVSEQRMNRAVLMLEGTDLSVEEISRQLGYKTKSGFHKAFREHYGTTPRAYLEQGRERGGWQ